MNKFTATNKIIFSLLNVLVAFAVTSCEKLKEDPLYVGTWEYSTLVTAGELTFNTTRTLVLSRKTYQEVYVIQLSNSPDISSILGTRGDFSVKSNRMTFKMNGVGECIKNMEDKCLSDVEWFDKGTPTYNDYLQYIRESFSGEYDADATILRLVRDINNDGDTEDTGEDIEFTRK